jgi:hypothetical protein
MGPADGEILLIIGRRWNTGPVVDAPFTTTATLPVVAPPGTGTAMLVSLQLDGVAGTPLKVTLPCEDPKPVPLMVTDVPALPCVGAIPEMLALKV